MLLRIFCLHFVGTSGMFLAQYLSGQWIFSWQNYWSAEKGWDYSKSVCGCGAAHHGAQTSPARSPVSPRQNRRSRALLISPPLFPSRCPCVSRDCPLPSSIDMLLMAPIREELVFRGLMFAIFYLRGAAYKVPSSAPAPAPAPAVASEQDGQTEGEVDGAVVPAAAPDAAAAAPESQESLAWTSRWKLDCVVASAVTFGLVHLLNLFGSRYTRTYIVLQVFLGMTLGAFYCLRFVLSQNAMLETVMLHVINNVFSSFLPVEAELDLSSAMVSLPRQNSSTHTNTCRRVVLRGVMCA